MSKATDQQHGETMFQIALDLIGGLEPDDIKHRFAMLMLYHHALSSGTAHSPESMATLLDEKTLTLSLHLAEALHAQGNAVSNPN